MEDRFKYKILNTKTNKFVEKGVEQYLLRDDGVICLCYFESIDPMFDLKPIFCTGFKDKNGKLIYEGDIVKFKKQQEGYIPKIIGVYVWRKYDACFDVKVYINKLYVSDLGINFTSEIIGNIYENPELIKGD